MTIGTDQVDENFIKLVGTLASRMPTLAYVWAVPPLEDGASGKIEILFKDSTFTDKTRNWLHQAVQEHGYVVIKETVDFDARSLYLWVKRVKQEEVS